MNSDSRNAGLSGLGSGRRERAGDSGDGRRQSHQKCAHQGLRKHLEVTVSGDTRFDVHLASR